MTYCCKDVVLTDVHAYELLDSCLPEEPGSTCMYLCDMLSLMDLRFVGS